LFSQSHRERGGDKEDLLTGIPSSLPSRLGEGAQPGPKEDISIWRKKKTGEGRKLLQLGVGHEKAVKTMRKSRKKIHKISLSGAGGRFEPRKK